MELRAERGRALLSGAPDGFEPSAALARDLHEWAQVAAAVCGDDTPNPDAAALVSARGRRLAARLASAAGTTVAYTDPIDGMMRSVGARHGDTSLGSGHRHPTGDDHHEPATGSAVVSRNDDDAAVPDDARRPAVPDDGRRPAVPDSDHADEELGPAPGAGDPTDESAPTARGVRPAPDPATTDTTGAAVTDAISSGARRAHGAVPATDEPTPWATGLVVSAFVATITLAAVVTLVRGLAEMGWLLGVLGLVVVTAGLGPSVWLARHTPLWRWVSYGVGAGLAVSWLSAALASLGS